MKKYFLLSLLFFNLIFCFGKEIQQFSISFEPEIGLLNGKIEESVTYFNENDERAYMSRLDWDVKNVRFFGADICVTWFKYLNLDFKFTQGISGLSGYMQDYDWLNPFTSYWKNDDPNELTNYSCHKNTLDNYSKIVFGASGNIPLPAKFFIVPGVGISEKFIKFTGSDGYSNYKSNNHVTGTFEGKQISYQQQIESLYLYLGFRSETIPHSLIDLNFMFFPLTNIEAVDHHIARNTYFWDKIYKCFSYEWNAKAYFMFNKNIGIGLKGNIQWIPNAYGSDWGKQIGNWGRATDNEYGNIYGGTNRFLWSVQSGLMIRI